MVKLTKPQALQVIEFFGAQAAEDAPVLDTDWTRWDKHMWMTCHKADLAIERQINPKDWVVLINTLLDFQYFDRDPAGYLNDRGDDDTEANRNGYDDRLKDLVSWAIDTAYRNSGA